MHELVQCTWMQFFLSQSDGRPSCGVAVLFEISKRHWRCWSAALGPKSDFCELVTNLGRITTIEQIMQTWVVIDFSSPSLVTICWWCDVLSFGYSKVAED